jgi:hypothetical protein
MLMRFVDFGVRDSVSNRDATLQRDSKVAPLK